MSNAKKAAVARVQEEQDAEIVELLPKKIMFVLDADDPEASFNTSGIVPDFDLFMMAAYSKTGDEAGIAASAMAAIQVLLGDEEYARLMVYMRSNQSKLPALLEALGVTVQEAKGVPLDGSSGSLPGRSTTKQK